MANSLDGSTFAEHYVREAQEVDDVETVYRAISKYNGFPAGMLSHGDTINIPKVSALYVGGYTRGSAVTVQDLTNTRDQLSINQTKQIGFYVDDFDKIQESFDSAVTYGNVAGGRMAAWKDADVLGEYANATHTIDASDVSAGTSGNGETVTTANIYKLFTIAQKKLSLRNVIKGGNSLLFAVISPNVYQVLEEYLMNKGTPFGDEVTRNGYRGRIADFDVFVSNNLASSFVLSLVTEVTTADTIAFVLNDYVDGSTTITITFRTSLTGAGTYNEVHRTGTVDTTRANLAALINNTGTVDTDHSDFSAVNRLRLGGLSATNDNSADTCTFVWEGAGTITISEALTDTTDTFTAAKQIQHQLFGVKGATNVVCQKEPALEFKDINNKFGKNILTGMLYGLKTTTAGARRLVDVKVRFDGTGF